MIQTGTKLKIADNTGAKVVEVIKVLGGSKKRYARIGDIVVVSVKSATPTAQIKKKKVTKALIIRQRANYRRPDGTYIRFDDNACILLDKEKALRGSRVFGPIPLDLKDFGFKKVISLAREVV